MRSFRIQWSGLVATCTERARPQGSASGLWSLRVLQLFLKRVEGVLGLGPYGELLPLALAVHHDAVTVPGALHPLGPSLGVGLIPPPRHWHAWQCRHSLLRTIPAVQCW